MSEITIELPDELREFVQEQAVRDGLSSPGAFIRHLLESEQKRRAREKLEEMLLEGVISGPPIEVDERWWENFREECRGQPNCWEFADGGSTTFPAI